MNRWSGIRGVEARGSLEGLRDTSTLLKAMCCAVGQRGEELKESQVVMPMMSFCKDPAPRSAMYTCLGHAFVNEVSAHEVTQPFQRHAHGQKKAYSLWLSGYWVLEGDHRQDGALGRG